MDPAVIPSPWRRSGEGGEPGRTDELFWTPAGAASTGEVIAWWEARRWPYNRLVFGVAIPSFCLYLFFVLSSRHLAPGDDAVEPLGLLAAPVVVPVLVNVGYSLGAGAELLWRAVSRDRSRRAGGVLMRLGACASVFLALLPSALWGVLWLWRVVVIG